ncbi:MAG TPA: hypothetical protein VET88_16015, partial [Gammaproteobacteria bacterium]|nr:hypothetical protein [Gammaproteobacteria bacterium]
VVLDAGLRTPDIASDGEPAVGTREMGDAVVAALRADWFPTSGQKNHVR